MTIISEQARPRLMEIMAQLQKYLNLIYKQLKPRLDPIIAYFQSGTAHSALILLMAILLLIYAVVWQLIPALYYQSHDTVQLSTDDWQNLRPNRWFDYSFETEASFPIGIRSWIEQREFGVISTMRSDDSYWGVYTVGDYYIYHKSDNPDALYGEAQTLTGRLAPMDRDILREIQRLIPDLPDNVLPVIYTPTLLETSLTASFGTMLVAIALLLCAFWFHRFSRQQRAGTAST